MTKEKSNFWFLMKIFCLVAILLIVNLRDRLVASKKTVTLVEIPVNIKESSKLIKQVLEGVPQQEIK